jgi:hypothetical protein
MAKRSWLLDGVITGLAGAAATTATIAALGQAKEGSPWTPFNAIAHMFFGENAASVEGFAPKETLSGLGLNLSALGVWGGLYEKLAGRVPFPQSLGAGAAAAALIWLLDYKILPERLRPGFEKRLGPESIAAVYVLLALTLGLSPLWKGDGEDRR